MTRLNRRILVAFLVFSFFWGPLFAPDGRAQSTETHGVVTQTAGPRIVVEMDDLFSVSEGTHGRIFEETGREVTTVTVQSASGSLVIAQVGTGSIEMVEAGQRVAFASVEGGERPQGTLMLRSNPSGAEVRLIAEGSGDDNRTLGTTPATVTLPVGTHRLRLRRSGYVPLERIVELGADTTRTMQVDLMAREGRPARQGSVAVRGVSDKASVHVDGEKVGTGPLIAKVEEGEHEVKVRGPNRESRRRMVLVEAGKRRVVEFESSEAKETLRVTSTPVQALVVVDGKEVGRTPVDVTRSAGKQLSITVDKEWYESEERTITLSEREDNTLDITLQRSLDVQLAAQHKGPVQSAQLEREGEQIRIQYALPRAEEPYEVSVELSLNGGATYEAIPREVLLGDVGKEVTGEANRSVRWEALEQYTEGLKGEKHRVRLVAEKASSRNFPGRPGVVLEALLTPTLTFGSGVGEQDGAIVARVGYATESVAVLLTGFQSGLQATGQSGSGEDIDLSADIWGLGPRLDIRLAHQGDDWPIAMHTTLDYTYSRSSLSRSSTFRSGGRLQDTGEAQIHRLAWGGRAYYVFSLADNFEIIPEVSWNNLAVSRIAGGIETEGLYDLEQKGERTTVSFGGYTRAGLGVFLGSRNFGVHLKAVGYLSGAGVGLWAGLRF
jgi:hypothetical protein